MSKKWVIFFVYHHYKEFLFSSDRKLHAYGPCDWLFQPSSEILVTCCCVSWRADFTLCFKSILFTWFSKCQFLFGARGIYILLNLFILFSMCPIAYGVGGITFLSICLFLQCLFLYGVRRSCSCVKLWKVYLSPLQKSLPTQAAILGQRRKGGGRGS